MYVFHSMQERIAEKALEGSLSSQNVTIVGDILTALANSSGQRQLESFSTIMMELLEQLGQEVNLHLMTAETGEVRLVHCTKVCVYATLKQITPHTKCRRSSWYLGIVSFLHCELEVTTFSLVLLHPLTNTG